MKNLRLPLTGEWFEMTKSGEKTEDYREINAYWLKRLLNIESENDNHIYEVVSQNSDIILRDHKPKEFDKNVMTWGYPKNSDKDKILEFQHKGIEIGFGIEEWGAEKGKKYFIIKHGKRL